MNGSFGRMRSGAVTASMQDAVAAFLPFRATVREDTQGRGKSARAQIERALTESDLFRMLPDCVEEVQAYWAPEEDVFAESSAFLTEQGRFGLRRLAGALKPVRGMEVEFVIGTTGRLARARAELLDTFWPVLAPGHPAMIGVAEGEGGLTVRIRHRPAGSA